MVRTRSASKPGVTRVNSSKGADQETGTGEEDQRERDLGNDDGAGETLMTLTHRTARHACRRHAA
jgi:hypothetical protein